MQVGKINKLKVTRISDRGYNLEDEENNSVYLPNTEVDEKLEVEDFIDVFIFKNSEGTILATTTKPNIQLDEFAFLKVKEVSKFGAFMDWGIAKDILVPFSEQTVRMKEGEWYVIFLTEDEETGRLFGSSKVNDFVFFTEIDVKQGDEVELLCYEMTELGMHAIVNNLYRGLIFNSDIHKEIKPGDKLKGYVKQVRDDGKIDVVLEPMGYEKSIDQNTEIITKALKESGGFLELTDKSSPEEIKQILGLSKKAFKKVIGSLYKQRLIQISDKGIKLIH